MTGSGWERIQTLFLRALDVDPPERAAWVQANVSDDEGRKEVMSLLAAHDRESPFDELAAGQDARDVLAAEEPEGTRFDAWEVVGELGRGGMGVVYHVRRVDGQFEQEGALKVLAADLESAGAEARFFAERQILAELSHPNIAKLLDGGVTPDGRPYFVMERVEGISIDEHCDARRLSTRQRLRLFLTVCGAVQHAHQSLVVHRDLKPSNILVSPEGVPKLLDFGIAKLLMAGLEARRGARTLEGSRLYTPGFASPEQLAGRPITTASDVYQLGVLLYLVLAGCHPYDDPQGEASTSGATSVPDSIIPPSRRLRSLPNASALAAARGTTPDRVKHQLAGDLDAIVLKALRPEPEHRYGSAGQLADDIRRHLDRRPVRARPDTVAYRGVRFLRRNVAAAVAVLGAFLAVLGFAMGVQRQARETAVERDRGQQIVDFLVELFGNADPYQTRGDEVTVREVLDRGAERAGTELSDEPAVQATLLETIAEVYRNLGVLDTSLELQTRALEVRRRTLHGDTPHLAAALVRVALLQAEVGDFEAVDTLLPTALEMVRGTGPSTSKAYVDALNDIGYAWQVRGSLDRAEPLLEESLGIMTRTGGAGLPIAATLNNLGNVRQARGDLDSAAVLFRRSVQVRRTEAPDNPRLATSLESLAGVLLRLGALDEADQAASEALEIRRRVFPEGHLTIAGPLHLRAMIMLRRGRPEEAEPLMREALAIREAALGEDHYVVAYARNALALILQQLGRLDEAEGEFRRSLDVYSARFGADHPNAVAVEANLARLLFRRGAEEEGRARFEHALPIARRTWPKDRRYASDLITLGVSQCQGGSAAHADSTLREAVEALRPADGQNTPDDFLRAMNGLGSCLYLKGRSDEAGRVLRESLDASAGRPDEDPYRAFALAVLAKIPGSGG